MSNLEKRKVPKRRFKEFENAPAWEQHKFMELIDNIVDFRGKTPKKLGMTWSSEGILALSAQNVKEGYIDKTIDAHYGGQALYNKWMSGRELHKGQVIFTTEAPMGNVARIPDKNKYILSQRAIAFNVNNAMVTEGFLMYLLESPSVKNNLLRISSGGTAKGISQKTLSSLMVKVPISLKEQERISFEFYNIDTLITLQQRKLNKLNNLKKSYLAEMFPAEGKRKPKRRFAGFTDAWEQRKLGDVLYTLPFKPYLKAPELDGKYEVIQQGNNPIIGFSNGNPCNDFKNTVIFGDHTLSIYKPKHPFFVATDGVRILKGLYEMNGYYLFSLLEKNKPKAEGYKRYYSILTDKIIFMTNNHDEQEKIGNIFHNLDTLITLQQRKINKLKKLKDAYLNEMFV